MGVAIASIVGAIISSTVTVIIMCILRVAKDGAEEVKIIPKKKECKACGFEFTLEKENRYLSKKSTSLLGNTSEKPTIFETFDCPNCGCQNIAGIYEQPIEGEVK